MGYDIEVVDRAHEHTAVVCGQVPQGEVGAFIGQAFGEVLAVIGGETGVSGPPFCRIDMAGEQFALEVGFPVPTEITESGRVVNSSLPGGQAATTTNVGPYESVAPAYFAIEQWLAEHGYVGTGAPWETYLDGPEVAQPRTIVTWPCHPADAT